MKHVQLTAAKLPKRLLFIATPLFARHGISAKVIIDNKH